MLSSVVLVAGVGTADAAAATKKGKTVKTVSGGETATAVSTFLNSLGVNTHFDYPDTPYGSQYAAVKKMLIASGITHVRNYDTAVVADLGRSGIRSDVPIDQNDSSNSDPSSQLRALKPLVAAGYVDALEGPNEPDNFWVARGRTYGGAGFPDGALRWQRDLYTAAKSDPVLAKVPVYGPSLGITYWGRATPYAANQLAPYVDDGNFHPYPAANPFNQPTPYAGLSQYYRQADFPSIDLDRYPIDFTTYQPMFGNHPMVATETGYSTWTYGQSERMQGVYTPRVFLENFRLGIPRTYLYEFVDEFSDPSGGNKEAHYGLLRNDLTPKPAYTAVKSLTSVLKDTAGTVRVGTLAYGMTVTPPAGYDATYLHHELLEKSDGTFVLALWHEVSGDDTSGLGQNPPQPVKEVAQPSMAVSLSLPAGTAKVTGQTITDQGTLAPAGLRTSGSTVSLDVSDHVTLVTINAGTARTTRTTARDSVVPISLAAASAVAGLAAYLRRRWSTAGPSL